MVLFGCFLNEDWAESVLLNFGRQSWSPTSLFSSAYRYSLPSQLYSVPL